MSLSRKYGRTYHYPFSPGATSDDRINHNYWADMQSIKQLVHTEKLDGENTCLNKYGVFARSHAAPTQHPWANYLKEKWAMIKYDLGNLEIFGENIYAIHSIQYQSIEAHFYVFGIRELDRWLSWEETKFYAALLDFHMVPELAFSSPTQPNTLQKEVIQLSQQASYFGSIDTFTKEPCTMEGLVSRTIADFSIHDFKQHVFKYVRKGHVKTAQHWSRNWKRAPLHWEYTQKP
ncbi:MAG: RNA ligase family protein [Flammeovirgaceae bacterium]